MVNNQSNCIRHKIVQICVFCWNLNTLYYFYFFNGTPICLLHISSSWVKIRLYQVKVQLMLRLSWAVTILFGLPSLPNSFLFNYLLMFFPICTFLAAIASLYVTMSVCRSVGLSLVGRLQLVSAIAQFLNRLKD